MITWNDTGTVAGFRLFLVVVSMIFGGLAALGTLGAFFASSWWVFDYVTILRWYLFWILVAAVIVYALTARGLMLYVFLAAAAVNAFYIVPLWTGDQPASTGEQAFTVVHLDATGGFDEREEAFDWLREVDADLLLVANATNVLAEGVTDDEADWTVLRVPEVENTAGWVILGRTSVGGADWNVAEMPTGVGSDVVLRITAGIDTTYEIITANGPTAASQEKADRLAARLATVQTLVGQSTSPVVVTGNLGATTWTSGMRTMLDESTLRDALTGEGYVATSLASSLPLIGGWVGLPLDVVLMTDDVTTSAFEAGPDISATHLPIRFTITPVE